MYLRAVLGMLKKNRPTLLPRKVHTTVASVDAATLARYQRLCGYTLTDRLPPAYPHIMGFKLSLRLMSGFDFPFPVVGLVHIHHIIYARRELVLGEKPLIRVWADKLRDHPRGKQFDIITTATVGDFEVWREIATYLSLSKKPENREHEEVPAPTPHAVWRVGPEIGKAYAKVSGDRNPIHTSRRGAKLFGFPGSIAHGMWSLSRCLGALEGRVPNKFSVEVEFKAPLTFPERVGFLFQGTEFELFDDETGRTHLIGRIAA
jgi:acyl dehydratase